MQRHLSAMLLKARKNHFNEFLPTAAQNVEQSRNANEFVNLNAVNHAGNLNTKIAVDRGCI